MEKCVGHTAQFKHPLVSTKLWIGVSRKLKVKEL
jgi:hypothetical protein